MARPTAPFSRTVLRTARRVVRLRTSNALPVQAPLRFADPALPRGDFAPQQLRRSFEASLKRLRREQVAALLLHEAYPDNTSYTDWETLRALRDERKTILIGLGNGSIANCAGRRLAPEGAVIQAAAPPELFSQTREPTADRLHSIVKSFAHMVATNAAVRSAAAATANAHAADLGLEAQVVLAYTLLIHRAPTCALLFSTTNRSRAENFLSAIAALTPLKISAIVSTYDATIEKVGAL